MPKTLICAFVSTATLVAMAAAANSQARFDSRRLSCAQANSLIQSRGSVLLTTGQFTYDMYVANRNHCMPSEDARETSIPTSDMPDCRVHRCVVISRGGR